MLNVLVATPRNSIDMLISDADKGRLESIVNVSWRTGLNQNSTEDEYAAAIAEAKAEIVMIGWGSPFLTPRILDQTQTVRCVVNLTGALKNMVHRDCIERGLTVTNWGDAPAPSVAEATLMMTLMSLRRAYFWQTELHMKKAWQNALDDSWAPQGLFDKTVGLYGFGQIARAFVPMLKPINPRILVFSSWISEEEKTGFGVETVASLSDLFAKSDIVSIHTGNRPDTCHTVNAEALSVMKDGGHIINTARGAIIDIDALTAELKSGRLFAALDVYETEPLPADSPLRGLRNCLLFPHQGGPTADYRFRCGANAVDQVQRYVNSDDLKHVITLKQYDMMT